MNLQQTEEALKANNIVVAINIGVHQYCDINSNCPLAVELRRYIHDSGITLEQLLKGFVASQGAPPESVDNGHVEFDGRTAITIGNQSIPLDFNVLIGEQLRGIVARKLADLDISNNMVADVGRGLYNTYLNQISQLRNTRTLPQLGFSVTDMIKAGCSITMDGSNYIFLFARHYKPQWIVTSRRRHELATRDVKKIENDIYIRLIVTGGNKILKPATLDKEGRRGFEHYHGSPSDDCWGHVTIPERWDGTLQNLVDLVTLLMGSLATINRDSILKHHPTGMPTDADIFQRSTLLGREGEAAIEVEQPEEDEEDGGEVPAPRRWGNGRTRNQNPTDRHLEMFGTREEVTDMGLICTHCGRTYENHFGTHPNVRCTQERG